MASDPDSVGAPRHGSLEVVPLEIARADAAAGDWESVRARLADDTGSAEENPEAVLLLAEAEVRLRRPFVSRTILADALLAWKRHGPAPLLRRTANALGAAHFVLGEIDDAERAFDLARELAARDGDDLQLARAITNLGAIASLRGLHRDALAMHERAIPAYQRAGDATGIAETFHNMAVTFRDSGQLDLAESCETRAADFALAAGDARLENVARLGLAELSLLRGDAVRADRHATIAAVESAAALDPCVEADALRLVGVARRALSADREALEALDRAVDIARRTRSALVQAEALCTRAVTYESLGALPRALGDAEEALALFTRLGARPGREGAASLVERLRRAE